MLPMWSVSAWKHLKSLTPCRIEDILSLATIDFWQEVIYTIFVITEVGKY